jgi:hypothetical protein
MWLALANGCALALFAAYAVISLAAIGYWAWRSCFDRPCRKPRRAVRSDIARKQEAGLKPFGPGQQTAVP